MLAFTLPGGAAAIAATPPTHIMAASTATHTAPIPAEPVQSSRADRDAQQVENRMAYQPEQFRCLSPATRQHLTPANAIPTANVSSTISFDPKTGGYAVITADYPNIVISHKVTTERSPYAKFTFDEYSWSFAANVKPYAMFVRDVSEDGDVYWGNYTLKRHSDGMYHVKLLRSGDKAWVAIVATDTTTCEPGRNTLPARMWKAVEELH